MQAMSVEAMGVISGLVWPGALMTRREAPFPLCMASSCWQMEILPRRSVLSHPNGIQKLKALSLPLCRCKSLVKCEWPQLHHTFSIKMYMTAKSLHTYCVRGTLENICLNDVLF